MANKAVAIKAVVVAMLGVIGRTMLGPMPWMPMSSRCILHINLKGINQDHLVSMYIWLIGLCQKAEFRNCSLQRIAWYSIA